MRDSRMALLLLRVEPRGSFARLTARMCEHIPIKPGEKPMIRKTILAAATFAAIGAAALIDPSLRRRRWQRWWGNGRRPSRPRRPWLLGRRVRRRCADRPELLAVDPGRRQGVRLLLIFADDSNSIQCPGLASRNRGSSMRRAIGNSFCF